jgi:serine/threonine protein phosphatase PrpC
MMLTVAEQAFKTDTGRQRHANEDAYFARAPVFAVADGMGGAQAGEVASRIATDAFEREFGSGPAETELRRMVEGANREIHDLAQRDESVAGMGTTLTAAVISGDEVALAHVGDSRAYRLRGTRLERLTKDHSLVEELRSTGQLTDEQAEDHPQRSIITRALGPEERVRVDTLTVQARPGDIFLLCSDGLTTMVDEDRIAQILVGVTSLDAAVRSLVDEANRAGGRDNITAVAFRLEEVGAVEEEEAERPTLVGPAAGEEGLDAAEVRRAAAADRARREAPPRRRLRAAAKWVAAACLLAAVCFGAWYGNRQIWFLGTDDAGRVALYRGLPYDLPLGINLYEERYASPIQTDSLPPQRRDSVTGHELRSRSDAVSLIGDIERSQGIP